MTNLRSADPRPGDWVMIHLDESPFNNLRAIVRNVYREKNEDITISCVVHPKDATEYIIENVPRAPDGGYHTMLTKGEFEIYSRSTQA